MDCGVEYLEGVTRLSQRCSRSGWNGPTWPFSAATCRRVERSTAIYNSVIAPRVRLPGIAANQRRLFRSSGTGRFGNGARVCRRPPAARHQLTNPAPSESEPAAPRSVEVESPGVVRTWRHPLPGPTGHIVHPVQLADEGSGWTTPPRSADWQSAVSPNGIRQSAPYRPGRP